MVGAFVHLFILLVVNFILDFNLLDNNKLFDLNKIYLYRLDNIKKYTYYNTGAIFNFKHVHLLAMLFFNV